MLRGAAGAGGWWAQRAYLVAEGPLQQSTSVSARRQMPAQSLLLLGGGAEQLTASLGRPQVLLAASEGAHPGRHRVVAVHRRVVGCCHFRRKPDSGRLQRPPEVMARNGLEATARIVPQQCVSTVEPSSVSEMGDAATPVQRHHAPEEGGVQAGLEVAVAGWATVLHRMLAGGAQAGSTPLSSQTRVPRRTRARLQ